MLKGEDNIFLCHFLLNNSLFILFHWERPGLELLFCLLGSASVPCIFHNSKCYQKQFHSIVECITELLSVPDVVRTPSLSPALPPLLHNTVEKQPSAQTVLVQNYDCLILLYLCVYQHPDLSISWKHQNQYLFDIYCMNWARYCLTICIIKLGTYKIVFYNLKII